MRGASDIAFRRMHRIEAWHDQDHLCRWCFKPLSWDEVTAEHLRPKFRGGLDHRDNIAAACRFCNRARGSISTTVFKRILSGGLPCPSIEIRTVMAVRRIWQRTHRACKRIRGLVAA